jgi:AcrR family transcriptional regulator
LKNKEKALEKLPTDRLVLAMHTTQTKQNIILSLLKLGSEQGLQAISLSTLAKENKISKAAMYHHFASREAMIEELFSYCNTLAYQQMATISLSGSPAEVLSRAMDHWHDLYANAPMRYFYRIIQTEALTHQAAKAIQTTLDEMLQGQSRILLESLSESSRLVIEDLDLAVLTFSSVVQQFLRRILLDETEDLEWEEERFIQNFCTLYQGR